MKMLKMLNRNKTNDKFCAKRAIYDEILNFLVFRCIYELSGENTQDLHLSGVFLD